MPHCRIIYRINCSDTNALRHHTALAFEDAPVPGLLRDTSLSRHNEDDIRLALEYGHLEGTRPIHDLDSCLTAEDDVAFIIVRESYCSEGALHLSQVPLSRVWHENLWLKSSPLRSALTAIACCYISNVEEKVLYWDGVTKNGSLVATRQICSPHLFLYHHRARLREYVANHPDAQSHIGALLEYASEVYGNDYREADELLSKALVTRRHLVKLFAPNELIFTYTEGQPTAYVVLTWPSITNDGHLELDCWSWKSDGAMFIRKMKSFWSCMTGG